MITYQLVHANEVPKVGQNFLLSESSD